jgi:MFS superfamily sulfate permease-like transporter
MANSPPRSDPSSSSSSSTPGSGIDSSSGTTTGTSAGTFSQDLLASVVVFLVALPLCMGIAIASGVPPTAGLITGVIGGLVVGALAGNPLQVSGPAAGLAVLVYELVTTHGFSALGPIIIAGGLLQMLAAALRLGQLFRAIAPAVIYGMLAGIGILIFGAQFHVMVDDAPRENGLKNLLSIPEAIWKGLTPVDGSSHHLAAILGLTTIVTLILWARYAPARVKWVPGALVAVVLATAVAQIIGLDVRYVDLPDSLFASIQLPTLAGFARLAEPQFLLAAVALAFVASAETLLSATAVDQMHDGPRTKYNKELFSQGIGNTLSGLLGGLPMTGVIVRSATNVAAGARTRRSTMLHGAWLLVMVAAAPWLLRLVPTASLAAVLVYTGYKLVNPQNVKRLLHYGGFPILIYAVTVVTIVSTDLLTGIMAGLALSLLKVLYALSRLDIDVQGDENTGRLAVHLNGAATFMRLPQLVDTLEKLPVDRDVHVRIDGLTYIDHAAADALDAWERKRQGKAAQTVVEWREVMTRYRTRNPIIGPTPGDTAPAGAGGH